MKYKLSELMVLNLYLGTAVWILGTVVQIFLLKESLYWQPVTRRVLILISAFLLSQAIALGVWFLWRFPFDIMAVQIIHLPTLAAQIVVVLLMYLVKAKYPK